MRHYTAIAAFSVVVAELVVSIASAQPETLRAQLFAQADQAMAAANGELANVLAEVTLPLKTWIGR